MMPFKSSIKIIDLNLTDLCNADCIFCPYQFTKPNKISFSMEMLKMIHKQMGANFSNCRFDITPLTGEAMINRDFIKISKYISQNTSDNNYTLYTNMTLAHKVGINNILNCGLENLIVSTAPFDKELYTKIYRNSSYEKGIKNTSDLLIAFTQTPAEKRKLKRFAIEFRGPLSIKECINLKDYKDFIEPYLSKDVRVSATKNFDTWMGNIKEDDVLPGMKLIKKKPTKFKLITCHRMDTLRVFADGSVRVCGARIDTLEKSDEFIIGNINQSNIVDLYNSSKTRRLKLQSLIGKIPETCKNCTWYMR